MLQTQSLLKLLLLNLMHRKNLALVDLVMVHIADAGLITLFLQGGVALNETIVAVALCLVVCALFTTLIIE